MDFVARFNELRLHDAALPGLSRATIAEKRDDMVELLESLQSHCENAAAVSVQQRALLSDLGDRISLDILLLNHFLGPESTGFDGAMSVDAILADTDASELGDILPVHDGEMRHRRTTSLTRSNTRDATVMSFSDHVSELSGDAAETTGAVADGPIKWIPMLKLSQHLCGSDTQRQFGLPSVMAVS
jgi:hypothetical protein